MNYLAGLSNYFICYNPKLKICLFINESTLIKQSVENLNSGLNTIEISEEVFKSKTKSILENIGNLIKPDSLSIFYKNSDSYVATNENSIFCIVIDLAKNFESITLMTKISFSDYQRFIEQSESITSDEFWSIYFKVIDLTECLNHQL